MSYFKELHTGQDVAAFVSRHCDSVEVIAETEGGNIIQAVRLGGDRKPPILLKAGNHSSEIAGIQALLTMVSEGFNSPFETYLIPCGDPFGFGGYSHALSHAGGRAVTVKSDEDCWDTLNRMGEKVYGGDHFALFRVGETIFAYVDQEHLDPRTLFYGQLDQATLTDAHLRAQLSGRRVFFPNTLYLREDYGPYDKAGLVAWTSRDGYLSNLNRLYDRYDVPPELSGVRDFCERHGPAMVIDLHESCINTRIPRALRDSGEQLGNHFLILPPVHAPSYESLETPVAEAMLKATERAGIRCFTRNQLEAAWGYPETEYFHGYVRKDVRDGMPFYRWAIRFADVSITQETSMDMPVEQRIQIHTILSQSAIDAFAERLL